jgi:transposase
VRVVIVRGKRQVVQRQRFACSDTAAIAAWFKQLGKYRVVVEATASYEWFVKLVEPTAERVVLAHPKKLRVIAESKRKSDKIDAFVLAEFLALDMIPEAWRPTPRLSLARLLLSRARLRFTEPNQFTQRGFRRQRKDHMA